jgi:hypothetical protein
MCSLSCFKRFSDKGFGELMSPKLYALSLEDLRCERFLLFSKDGLSLNAPIGEAEAGSFAKCGRTKEP